MTLRSVDAKQMESLRKMVPKDRFSTGDSVLNLHSRDQSFHPPSRPDVVIWPILKEEVCAVLKYSDENRIPVTGWGSGTSMEGNPIPVKGGIVLDFTRMNRIIQIREQDFQADLEPGAIYQDLNERLRHKGLFFPPDPGARATIGGMIGNNASGTRTVKYGSTRDYVLRLTIALANGELIETGTRASKTSSGYDLVRLFVGSEGTLGLVVEATVRLTGIPCDSCAAVVTFPSLDAAGKSVFEIKRSGLDPAALELMDPECIMLMNREKGLGLSILPTLFMEYHGSSRRQISETLQMVEEICRDAECIAFKAGFGKAERDRLFQARHELGEMIIRNHPGCGVLVVDVAVPVTAYPDMIAAVKEEMKKGGVAGYIFSHAGDGNLHVNLVGKKEDPGEWGRIYSVADRTVANALAVGGTATGEHGVGIGKRKFMEAEHGKSLQWMKRIKTLFDPNGILNPGKMFPYEDDLLKLTR